jgi:hypothetical protein
MSRDGYLNKKELQLYIWQLVHILFLRLRIKVRSYWEHVGGTHQELEEHCSQPVENLMGTH